jgi:lipopolysaccharide transport system ATP-binding protein
MDSVIKVEGLSKRYYLGHQQVANATIKESLSSTTRSFCRRLLHPLLASSNEPIPGVGGTEEFWALRDVSFDVKQGERIGIIGCNGAGKSTLLKILSRITEPTTGRVGIRGRTTSLLEVGTGFHPELTGRENIFLNGAIMGMGREEIRRKFDEIVTFAEVEKFLDTPVKRYSSGMYVRLAFAVAAHLEPEILIVDEVLAVGDAAFQKKCLGKIRAVGQEGQTVLFVSHNMMAVRQLCSRAILMQDGRIVDQGFCEGVVEKYIGRNQSETEIAEFDLEKAIACLPEDPIIRITNVEVKQGEDAAGMLVTGKPICVSISYLVKKSSANLRVFFDLLDENEALLFRNFHDCDYDLPKILPPGNYCSEVVIPANFLAPIKYKIRIGATIFGSRSCTGNHLMLPLKLYQNGRVNRAYTYEVYLGQLAPLLEWKNFSCY